MNESTLASSTPHKEQGGLLYVLLIVVLLGAVFLAGAMTTVTAINQGFTPIENGPPTLPGH
jgi:hypothetical protein